MFNSNGKKKDYSQLNLDDFSDDDSETGNGVSNGNGNGNRNGNRNGNDKFRDDDDDGNGNGYIDDDPNESDDYIRNQQVLMKQQDEGLDVLSHTIMRLGDMSTNISEELGQQNKMLDSMETDLDTANEDLDLVTRSTKQLIAKSGGTTNFCIIAALSIAVFVLLFLIIYV